MRVTSFFFVIKYFIVLQFKWHQFYSEVGSITRFIESLFVRIWED